MTRRSVPVPAVTLALAGMIMVTLIIEGIIAGPAWGEFFQKQFIICKDQGRDVLCDPVVVQKNDYVIRLFKQKGEIAHSDFPLFLGIFKRLNPEVKDLDLIYPGQQVIVPLKIVEPGTLEGQATGTVSIPFIAITKIPAQIQKNSMNYVVMRGDSVSSIISRILGGNTPRSYKEALEIFKYLNPDIKDLNRIQAGQTVTLPTRKTMEAPWYPGLFDGSGNMVAQAQTPSETPAQTPAQTKKPATIQEPVMTFQPPPPKESRLKIGNPLVAPKPVAVAPLSVKPAPAAQAPKPFVPKPVAIKPVMAKPVTVKTPLPKPPAAATVNAVAPKKQSPPPVETPKAPARAKPLPERPMPLPSIFKKASAIFSAHLLDTGEYFFPRSGTTDLRVDLAATPVMEFPSGFRLLFARRNALSAQDQKVITGFWKNAGIVTLSYDAPLRELLSAICRAVAPSGCENRLSFVDGGVSVSARGDYIFDAIGTPGKTIVTLIDGDTRPLSDALRRYLSEKQITIQEWIDAENHFGPVAAGGGLTASPTPPLRLTFDPAAPSRFVRDLAAAFGLRYQEKVEITFPYAGFQVKAVADLLSMGRGREILVDFGDIQGDAVKSIEATGFQVLQVRKHQDADAFLREFLAQLPARQEPHPVFWAAERPESGNIRIQIPGKLISLATDQGTPQLLITDLALNDHLLAFLAETGVQVARIGN